MSVEVESLSIADQAELARFRKMLEVTGREMATGASHPRARLTAYTEIYGDPDAEPECITGEEGVRDTQHPCADFAFGKPHTSNRCEGDGHYLCNECRNKQSV